MNLNECGEDELIQHLTSQLIQGEDVLVGPGDDCAVQRLSPAAHQLLKTDCVVESVHYLAEESGRRVGWKALARVVSDIAAMGGTPSHCVVTVALRPDTPLRWVEALYQGMQACASRHGCSIVGGETSSLPDGSVNVISVAGTGIVKPADLVLRSGGKVGDAIMVTGTLGGSISGKHLDFEPRLQQAQWLVKHYKPHAMMDLSDGLAKDLPRLAKQSQCGYHLDTEKIPCSPSCSVKQALCDGEDYELLFTIDPAHRGRLLQDWQEHFPMLPLSCVGSLTPDQSSVIEGGWDHFKD